MNLETEMEKTKHALEIAKAVRQWQKNSKKKRSKVSILAAKLKCRPEHLRISRAGAAARVDKLSERLRILEWARKELLLENTKLVVASAVRAALRVRRYSVDTVRRCRRPARQKASAAKKEKRRYAASIASENTSPYYDRVARRQGW